MQEETDMRRLWCHGKVDSMARPTRRCEAVGVENETIVFLGTDQEALTQNWDEIIDLEGRQVLPGFSDTHMHLLHYVLFQKIWPCSGWTPSSPSSAWAGSGSPKTIPPACWAWAGTRSTWRRAACPSGGTWTASPPKSPSACCGCAPTSPPATLPWWSG